MRYIWPLWACACAALFCAFAPVSCAGAGFTSSQAVGGASEQEGGGAADHPGAGRDEGTTEGVSHAGVGASSNGGGGTATLGDAGESASGGANASADGGAGGSFNGDAGADNSVAGCAVLHGLEFERHCYVDATVNSSSQQQAVTACAQLATEGKVPGHLLVLDSAEEQNFVLRHFMAAFTDTSDAWLGLTCHELAEPDINACYCSGCSQAALTEKQQAWAWVNGASSSFGWINGNPNGGYRCAALAYNPDSTIWGWVDRPCDKASFTGVSGHPHGYRTLCELEP
ncbi:MAG TPA: hypothetical protein VFK05_02745 [Polyangiaceae bacterium]|nr:hypothetical protein [Polyangiaceae bacterium]